MVKKAAQATPNRLLRTARKERGWTQKDVADRIGAPQAFNISRWENGTAFPSAHYIEQLCQLFGKSVSELGLLSEETSESSKPGTGASPSPLWTVPFRRNPFFTGREQVLKQLHERFSASRTVALTQMQAISGLGGIGKTQIAVEFSYRFREKYRFVLWVRAASRDALISDFVSLTGLLHLPEENEQDQNIVVAAMKRWLANHQGWLLILDNADDLELAAEFLPAGDNGHILLTTRAQATGSIAYSIAIEKMDNDEGMLLLLRRAKLLAPDAALDQSTQRDRNGAQAIVKALDGLPLALDQAGAYIEETGCGLAEYLEMYRQRRRNLLNRGSSVPAEYPYTVMSTWMLSFQQVEQANPAAADLLRLLAFLDPDAIPEVLLTAGITELDPLLGSVVSDPFSLNDAIQVLLKYSLVRRNPTTKILSVHRLVQAVLKYGLDEETHQQWAEYTVRLVNRAFPDVEFPSWSRCQDCLPHAFCCLELIEQHRLSSPEAVRLLTHTGWYLSEIGLYAQSEPFLRLALVIREQVSGSQHLETANSLNKLAELYNVQGKYEEAVSLYRRALSIQEQALGPEHRDLATSLNGLANIYYHQGKYGEGEPLYQRAIHIQEQALGSEPRDLAYSLYGLANIYTYQGKYKEAESLSQRALSIREQTLGPEHPHLALSLNGLANIYLEQGMYEEAEPLYRRALSIQEQALGPEHRDLAFLLSNLAELYNKQGRYGEAEPLCQRALSIQEQALGPEHPNLAHPLDGLANIYLEQGKYGEAEPLYQRALSIREQALGPEHPHLAYSLNGLANIYYHQGKDGEAEPLYQRALYVQEQTLGPEHPELAHTLYSLASFLHIREKHIEAASLFKRALAIQEKALGREHPETIATQVNYNNLLKKMQRLAELTYREGAE